MSSQPTPITRKAPAYTNGDPSSAFIDEFFEPHPTMAVDMMSALIETLGAPTTAAKKKLIAHCYAHKAKVEAYIFATRFDASPEIRSNALADVQRSIKLAENSFLLVHMAGYVFQHNACRRTWRHGENAKEVKWSEFDSLAVQGGNLFR